MSAVLLTRERRFQCPSCDRQIQVTDGESKARLHPCRALAGILAPFIEVTGLELDHSKQRHVVVEREDYVASEIVRTDDNGRPVMAVVTERSDGSNDCVAFAPTATNRRD